ncbi:MAG: SDR family NAD(P)-dependent oxidoreductase [Elusimicrobiaceae bacterium]|nr:SDR family NAD(P)-dependent oxidoreductase [Elusimicrobiaceae bacterium]
MNNKTKEPIAIVGIGAIMPGALSKDEFWNNIQSGKYCITEVPKSYWDPALFYSPDHKAEDKLYSTIGGFIPQEFKFNSIQYRIPPQIAKQMDTVQCLAIETTRMALEDSGYDKKEFDRNRCAVIVGNSLGGMKNEKSNTRLNKPFFYEILKETQVYKSLTPQAEKQMMAEMDESFRQKYTPITEDTMPGELPNVIAGRLANVFDVHGTNFTVDAACATSLAAVDQAVNGLREGNFDMAIVGGVDQMMSPSAYIKFCKIGALSEKGSCPFDAKADGFVMAEGAGTVILKRLSDAVKDGDKVYAVIRAVGASSDGKGKGITAPNPKGQKIAVEKTFEQLDYTPGDVGLVEAHGTSTRVGDAVELNALYEIFSPYAKPGTIGLGSVKSQIGHAKAAAGIASLIKTSMALYNKVLPPSVNFETPNPTVDWATSPFRVITKAEEWTTDKVRRANVSAFGFGGTNFHVALEEMNDGLLKKETETKVCCEKISTPVVEEKSVMNSNNYELRVPGEKIQGDVLTFSAPTKQELFNELGKAVLAIKYDPTYLPSISYQNHIQKPQKFAVSINVESPEKLKDKIEFFIKIASGQDVWSQDSLYLKMKGIYPFTPSEIKPKVCFMFPGQGSQYVDMMKDLASKYKVVQDTFDEADRHLMNISGQNLTDTLWSKAGETKEQIAAREEAIRKTEMTQPAMLTADIAMMRLLSSFGIKPDVVMGHSLGEYAAAVAAGIFDFENGLKAVCTRGKVMSEIRVEDNGKMASVAAPAEQVAPELKRINGYVAVANKNCPTQTVIAGASKAVDDAIVMFTNMGIQAVQIPVSHAFHSEIIRPAMPQYRAFLDTLEFHSPKMPITTNVTAEFYPNDPEKIKDLMVTQIAHSVEWIKQLKTTYESGVRLFVECGPKRVLSALATNTLSDKKDIRVLASNHPKKGGITEFNDLFANLISSGIAIDWTGTDMAGNNSCYNPAFAKWVNPATTVSIEKVQTPAQTPVEEKPCQTQAKDAVCYHKDIVISGISAGGPGSWDKVFREGILDEILSGRNMIESVSPEIQQQQIDKHVEFVVKSPDGNHRFERLTSPTQAIKLAAKGGAFDLEKEFGLPAKWVRSMDRSFQLAIAAGILALKDAGIPLVLYYKPTSTGGYLPDRWGLPADMIDETGVIFTSAFPVANSMMGDLTKRVSGLLNNKTAKEVRAFCDKFIAQISDPALKAEIENWYNENFKDKEVEPQAFTSEFILKTIAIAHSHFCQWIRARGPATAMSAACASTAQAIAIAQDWIKLGRCKRVIVISADDISNDNVAEWILTAFLASGAATTEAEVAKAALPFDRRRNGMIVGMGAVSLVVEEEAEVIKRGMKPLAKLLNAEIANSGFHVTRIDVNHMAQVMDRLVATAEKEYGLNRSDIAKQLVFISHETYTPARGGSASAEAYALKSTFGADVGSVIVSNTKGFTGHSMGAGLEDAIAVRCLNTGLVPPIANFQEADPELAGINLSKGGHYDFKYALHLAAGFGSQVGMTLLERSWQVGQDRISDAAQHQSWLKEISGQEDPVLEVVQNTLRIKDNYKHGVKPALVMEGSQAFVDKVKPAKAVASVAQEPAEQAAPVQAVAEQAPVVTAPEVAPAAVVEPVAVLPSLTEEDVTKEILNIVSEKTGYPEDMLDLDLDMEADLGIDTVKQAELFAIMREKYQIARQEGVQLKDYPTIRSIIKYALANAGQSAEQVPAEQAAPVQAVAEQTPVVTAPEVAPAAVVEPVQAPVAEVAPAAKAVVALDEATVTKEVVSMVAEKTGYPEDMLDLDLDMEADLGIDTVKQAELFAAMREHYAVAQQDGIQLKDYPTIRHCIKFVLSSTAVNQSSVAEETSAVTEAPVEPTLAQSAVTEEENALPVIKVTKLADAVPAADQVNKPSEEMLTTNPTGEIKENTSLAERPEREGYAGEHCHEKKLRSVTVVAPAPLTERVNRHLSKDRTVLIFADNSQLIKAYQEEFKELGVKTHVFTTLKTRSKNTTIVNWESYEETEAALKEYASEDPNIQGIVYLLGASVKKFDKKVSTHGELTKYVMPLFIALRVFERAMSNRTDADTFFVVNTKIDGNFGYTTKDEFNPITGALCGGMTCFRKDVYERTGALGKLLDFENTATPDEMAQKTMEEVLHGDMRLMVGTRGGERSTILSVPVRLDRSVKRFDLAGKTVIFTGAGRGIGAMLSQKLAAQYKSKIIVLDIIEIQEKTPLWASMNEAELAALKKQMWEELKADTTQKATPVLLERAFGKVKDSITLYNNLQKLRELGSEVEYYHCDVLNSSMVKEVCTKIKARNGRVDGLIHFAGLERSKLIYDKDPAEYYRIFDVKASSFVTFLENNIVRNGGFFAFASSIAGKYGNLGQSDYASANDYLAKSALSLSNQGYRAISVAMSAYKNVGMGVRAGVETFLRSNGVDFVDPEDGMQIFLDEIVYGDVPEIVLTGSLGLLDWDHQLRLDMDEIVPQGGNNTPESDDSDKGNGGPSAPVKSEETPAAIQPDPSKANHFLSKVVSQTDQEIHTEKEFNLESDPYLADHAIEGTPYVPGVMGIETFVETATALSGQVPQGLKDVHFFLPIKLLRNRPQAVRVIGKNENGEISMEIESDFINSKGIKMGNTRRHFTAKSLASGFVSTWKEVKDQIQLDTLALPQISKEEIYKKYFHGPSFQVLGGILKADKESSLALYNTTPRPQWSDAEKTLLANPMLIEAAFQCCGFRDMAIENKMTLPDGIKEIAVFHREVPPQKLYLYGRFKGLTADGKTLHDAYVFDEQGNVWVEIHGYQAIGQ